MFRKTARTIQDVAAEATQWFETARRNPDDDESYYVRVKDGAPGWITDTVHEAHGDMLPDDPDDWRYETIRAAVDWIAEGNEDTDCEFADSRVDVYTGQRLHWLASHLDRADYCDEAWSKGIIDPDWGIIERIGAGQYIEASHVYAFVHGYLTGMAE